MGLICSGNSIPFLQMDGSVFSFLSRGAVGVFFYFVVDIEIFLCMIDGLIVLYELQSGWVSP